MPEVVALRANRFQKITLLFRYRWCIPDNNGGIDTKVNDSQAGFPVILPPDGSPNNQWNVDISKYKKNIVPKEYQEYIKPQEFTAPCDGVINAFWCIFRGKFGVRLSVPQFNATSYISNANTPGEGYNIPIVKGTTFTPVFEWSNDTTFGDLVNNIVFCNFLSDPVL